MKFKYIKPVFTFVIFAFILAACGANKAEEQKKQQETLAKEVMDIHDEVMPKMGELVSLKKQVKQLVNNWTADSLNTSNDVKITEAGTLIEKLEAADKGMMDWMHEYNGGQGLYEHDLIMEYLNAEKVKITQVKTDMNASMDEAKQFLEANK